MNRPALESDRNRDLVRAVICTLVMILVTAAVLQMQGRVYWCGCASFEPWSWDVNSRHNSQHLIDAYFFSHILHGLVFYVLLTSIRWPGTVTGRFLAAVFLESVWEVLENSPLIIERYRAVTVSLGYYGDSIANSMVDILACSLEVLIACRAKFWQMALFFVGTELALVATIRDCLTLNVLMLAFPIDAVRQWQMSG